MADDGRDKDGRCVEVRVEEIETVECSPDLGRQVEDGEADEEEKAHPVHGQHDQRAYQHEDDKHDVSVAVLLVGCGSTHGIDQEVP